MICLALLLAAVLTPVPEIVLFGASTPAEAVTCAPHWIDILPLAEDTAVSALADGGVLVLDTELSPHRPGIFRFQTNTKAD